MYFPWKSDGLNGYKFRCIEARNSRNIIRRDVTFKEDEFSLKILSKDAIPKKHNRDSEETSVELELPALSLQNNEIIDDNTYVETSETSHTLHDQGYQLTRDRQKMFIKPAQRFGHADLITYDSLVKR